MRGLRSSISTATPITVADNAVRSARKTSFMMFSEGVIGLASCEGGLLGRGVWCLR
jgi:hypothetical protein